MYSCLEYFREAGTHLAWFCALHMPESMIPYLAVSPAPVCLCRSEEGCLRAAINQNLLEMTTMHSLIVFPRKGSYMSGHVYYLCTLLHFSRSSAKPSLSSQRTGVDFL